MIAGPNGSGKTTLTRHLMEAGIAMGTYINPDDIALGLNGTVAEVSGQAQRIADERRQACLADGQSFSFETVMSHESKIDILRHAKELDYIVILFFVALESPDLNVARVAQRVALGGHDVPEDRIRKRYIRCLSLLPYALRLCDRAVLFDNSYRNAAGLPVQLRPVCEVVRQDGLMRAKDANGRPFRTDTPGTPNWIKPIFDKHLARDLSRGRLVYRRATGSGAAGGRQKGSYQRFRQSRIAIRVIDHSKSQDPSED